MEELQVSILTDLIYLVLLYCLYSQNLWLLYITNLVSSSVYRKWLGSSVGIAFSMKARVRGFRSRSSSYHCFEVKIWARANCYVCLLGCGTCGGCTTFLIYKLLCTLKTALDSKSLPSLTSVSNPCTGYVYVHYLCFLNMSVVF